MNMVLGQQRRFRDLLFCLNHRTKTLAGEKLHNIFQCTKNIMKDFPRWASSTFVMHYNLVRKKIGPLFERIITYLYRGMYDKNRRT